MIRSTSFILLYRYATIDWCDSIVVEKKIISTERAVLQYLYRKTANDPRHYLNQYRGLHIVNVNELLNIKKVLKARRDLFHSPT